VWLPDTALTGFQGSQNRRAEAEALLLRGFFLHCDGQHALRRDAYWVSAEVHAAVGDFKLAHEHQQRATRGSRWRGSVSRR